MSILARYKLFMYFTYLYSRTDTMAGFHILRDPVFTNQGNGGWIEEDPEEIMEEGRHVEFEEEEEKEEEESDAETEVINPPFIARVPTHRRGYNGPTTGRAEDLER